MSVAAGGVLLVYGVTGYTGRLVLQEAVEEGLPVVAAGRDAAQVGRVAAEVGVAARAFGPDDPAVADHLDGVGVLLNCAGPFARTNRALARACLTTGAHYLDLAGEVPEHLHLLELDGAAADAGVMLLPGAGFGVVPTECIAAHVARRLPSATSLRIAYRTTGGASRGTVGTVLPGAHRAGVVRRDHALVPARPASAWLELDLGDRPPSRAVSDPWRADLVAAGRSTGIADVETFAVFPAPVVALMRSGRTARALLDSRPWQAATAAVVRRLPAGPTAAQLDRGRGVAWAQAADDSGRVVTGVVQGPDAYRWTAAAAVHLAGRALGGDAPPGYRTPSTAYGADVVLSTPGVVRSDLDVGPVTVRRA